MCSDNDRCSPNVCHPRAAPSGGRHATSERGFHMSKFTAFLTDESGAAAAEYVLILAIIGSAIAGSALAFGTAIKGAIDDAAAVINGIVIA